MVNPVRMDPFRTIVNVHWKEPSSEPESEPDSEPISEPPPSEPSDPFIFSTEYFFADPLPYSYDVYGWNRIDGSVSFGFDTDLPLLGSVFSGDFSAVPNGPYNLIAVYAVKIVSNIDPMAHPDNGTELNLLFNGNVESALEGKKVFINGSEVFTIDSSDFAHINVSESGGRTKVTINNNTGEFPPSEDWVYDLNGGLYEVEIREP